MNNIKYNSQFGQDKYIIEDVLNFKRNGYFIEIGTGDGVHISNTYTFEKYLNWSGICVECNPFLLEKLYTNRTCNIETSPVTSESNTVNFNAIQDVGYYNSYFSSIYDIPDSYKHEYKEFKLKSITLNQLLKKYKCPDTIDYLSIDTEGGEFETLKSFFDHNHKYNISIISIEHNFNEQKRNMIKSCLESKGYKFLKHLEVDDIYKLHV